MISEGLRKQQNQTKYQGFEDSSMLSSITGSVARWAHSPSGLCLCPLMAKGPGEKQQSRVHSPLPSYEEIREGEPRKMEELGHSMYWPLRGTLVGISETLQGQGCAARSV